MYSSLRCHSKILLLIISRDLRFFCRNTTFVTLQLPENQRLTLVLFLSYLEDIHKQKAKEGARNCTVQVHPTKIGTSEENTKKHVRPGILIRPTIVLEAKNQEVIFPYKEI